MAESKYIIINKMGDIMRLSEGPQPAIIMEGSTVMEVSEETAAMIEAGRLATPPVFYSVWNSVVMPRKEKIVLKQKEIAAKLRKERGISRKQTKLIIMRRLDALGKWETFKAIMAQMPVIVRDAWDLALEIDEADPLFVANKEMLIRAGITEVEFDSLFDS